MKKEIPIPQLECIDGDRFILAEDYPVKFVMWYRDFQFMIPKGSPTDLASIPRVFRFFIDRSSLGHIAPVIHDYLCDRLGQIASFAGEEIQLSRYEVNLVFLVSMLLDGISAKRAIFAYIGVWIGAPRWDVKRK